MKVFPLNIFQSILFIGILSLFAMECATLRDPTQIVERTELPIVNIEMEKDELILPVIFQIQEDGSVEKVNMLTTSGDSEWDRMAVDSLMKWRFEAPPPDDNRKLIRKNIRVQLLPQEVMNVGELIAGSEADANVLYSRLRAGISFEQLVSQVADESSIGRSGRYLEDVNTADYPAHISKILIDLNVGSFSRPVQRNGEYVIFKRYGAHLP